MRMNVDTPPSRIDANLLIPGRGDPVKDATLIFTGRSITWVGLTSGIPEEFSGLQARRVKVLMPGLWDCHVHYQGVPLIDLDEVAKTSQAVSGLRIARDIVATLNAGYTSVRELSGYGTQAAQVVAEGWLPGPRIYSAVSLLSPTAGHGDARGIPRHEFWDRVAHAMPAYVCDGEAECVKAVRVQVRQGADLIKVAASGGISTNGDNIMAQAFSDSELKAIVEEARRSGMIVAAHCHGAEGIKAALRTGCRTIEHGTFLDTDPEAIQMMVDTGAILVATRSAVEYALRSPNNWSHEQYANLREAQKHHANSYRQAIQAGVRVALGTDLSASLHHFTWNHGMNGVEFRYAIQAGLSPLQAIEAATATAPETLGPRAPRSGQLREGFDADFISLNQNPLDDIEVLADASNILNVWRLGKHYKVDGQPVSILNDSEWSR